ncbi:hypothetical protein GGX14DRAFT_405461 [Mycena pura]|uniref:Uncharacterized protein n=1 Tax=Mycena pura TaxID=153505 RepID=A0AAD6USB9_9AGAR|nr:hypothetical protein GGX14DRAFT_405461 [Mycena pura]
MGAARAALPAFQVAVPADGDEHEAIMLVQGMHPLIEESKDLGILEDVGVATTPPDHSCYCCCPRYSGHFLVFLMRNSVPLKATVLQWWIEPCCGACGGPHPRRTFVRTWARETLMMTTTTDAQGRTFSGFLELELEPLLFHNVQCLFILFVMTQDQLLYRVFLTIFLLSVVCTSFCRSRSNCHLISKWRGTTQESLEACLPLVRSLEALPNIWKAPAFWGDGWKAVAGLEACGGQFRPTEASQVLEDEDKPCGWRRKSSMGCSALLAIPRGFSRPSSHGALLPSYFQNSGLFLNWYVRISSKMDSEKTLWHSNVHKFMPAEAQCSSMHENSARVTRV